MKKAYLSLLFLTSVHCFAADICSTLSECTQADLKIQSKIRELISSPLYGSVAINSDGSLKQMSQTDATKYCSSQGRHLPTAREFAQLSTSLGAKGIIEPSDYKNEKDYFLVKTKDKEGNVDTFYFNNVGYKAPDGVLGNNWFWNSSTFTDNPKSGSYFYGYGGDINGNRGNGDVRFSWEGYYDTSEKLAVFCVTNK